MFKNYLKTAFRNLWKSKGYAFINLFGLSLSIISLVFILLFVKDEFNYDRFNKNAEDIYRVTLKTLNKDGSVNKQWALVSPGYGSQLKQDFASIENTVRFYPWSQPFLTVDDKKYLEERFAFADPDVFKIFSFELLTGDPNTALNEPNKLVISESMSKKYFGSDDPVGKTIQYKEGEDEKLLEITGLMKDIPRNSHFKFDFLTSFETRAKDIAARELNRLTGNYNYLTYIKLKKGADYRQLENNFIQYLENKISPEEKKKQSYAVFLQPLLDIHLKSNLDTEIEKNGNITNVYIFLIIGFLILIIACVNYSNLVIAKAIKRMKEISIRKVNGARRYQIIFQFLGEACITTFISVLIALVGIKFLLPLFNDFSGKLLTIDLFLQPWLILLFSVLILLVTLLAGCYPAFFLSKFNPIESLKKESLVRRQKFSLRSALIIFQFMISIGLIVGMIVIRQQMSLVTKSDLGFSKENIIVFRANGKVKDHVDLFKQQLALNKDINAVSASGSVPTNNLANAQDAKLLGGSNSESKQIAFRLPYVFIDQNFIKMYDLKLAAGNNIIEKTDLDTNTTFLLNEAAVRDIGWSTPEQAIGQRMQYGKYVGTLTGVVKDFHFESLRNKISPMIFVSSPRINWFSVEVADKARISSVLNFLKQKWQAIEQDYSFNYNLVDDNIEKLYEKENKLQTLITIFSLLAIVISSLGLFGLSAFVLEQRTKEIGIRKVLGASISSVVVLLSRGFLSLVIIAALAVFPLAWWLMNNWLQDFAYRIQIHWWVFAVAAIIALLIAFFTITFQAMKAAIANPIRALRTE